MNANELLDIIGEARSEYIMEAQRHRSGGKSAKRKLPAKRILLIAAVITLLVALVGFAAIVFDLDSLNLGQFSFDAGFGEQKTMDVISLQGYTGSKNFLAAQEWQQFLESYDPDGTLLKQADRDGYVPPREYDAYLCYTEEMVQKVDEICGKYELELLGTRYLDSGYWATCDAVGVDRIFAEDSYSALYETSGYHFQNGTFKIEGVLELKGMPAWTYPITFQYHSVQKSCFDTLYINVWDTTQYEQWEYTTEKGDHLLMALSSDSALMIYDGDDAFVTVGVISPQYGQAYMDKAALEAFADALLFDYTVQPVTEKPMEASAYYSDFADYISDLLAAKQDAAYAMEQVDGIDDDELIIMNEEGVIQEILTIREGMVQTMGQGGNLYLCEYRPLNPIMDINDPNYVYVCRIIEQESDVGGAVQHYYTYVLEDGRGVISDVLMECADGTYARSDNGGAAEFNWQTITAEEYAQLQGQYLRMTPNMKPIGDFFGTHTPDFTLFESAYLPIAGGDVGYDWEAVSAFLTNLGYQWTMGEGTYAVDDPMNPNSYLYGNLTTENGIVEIADVGYHLVLGDAQRDVYTAFTDAGIQHIVNKGLLRSGVWVPDIGEQEAFIKNIRKIR